MHQTKVRLAAELRLDPVEGFRALPWINEQGRQGREGIEVDVPWKDESPLRNPAYV